MYGFIVLSFHLTRAEMEAEGKQPQYCSEITNTCLFGKLEHKFHQNSIVAKGNYFISNPNFMS